MGWINPFKEKVDKECCGVKMKQCGVAHEWIIQLCWLSSRTQKEWLHFMIFSSAATKHGIVEDKNAWLMVRRLTWQWGPCRRVCVGGLLWFSWSLSGIMAQTETAAPEQPFCLVPREGRKLPFQALPTPSSLQPPTSCSWGQKKDAPVFNSLFPS